MPQIENLLSFRERENESDPVKETWVLAAVAAMIGAGIGADVLTLYRLATRDLPLETAKLVQRRFKETILKSTVFTGVPRTAAATRLFYRDLKDEEIDNFAPRYDSYKDPEEAARREARGQNFFDVLWTAAGAESVRTVMKKHHPDLYLLNQKLIYDFWASEDRILNNVETELLAIAALVTMNCPEPLVWHLKGAIRHGASHDQVELAYDVAMAVGDAAGLQLKHMPKLANIDLKDTTYL